MASDVTPLKERNGRPHASQSSLKTGPFHATKIWNAITEGLKNHVSVKRKKVTRSSYENCFTGSDAVEVVFQQLQAERDNFSQDITREKAIKVCQVMLDSHIFELVKGKGCKGGECTFEDAYSNLYRFLDSCHSDSSSESLSDCSSQHCTSCQHMSLSNDKHSCSHSSLSSGDSLEGGEHGEVIGNPTALHRHVPVVQEILEITGTWKRRSMISIRKVTPIHLFRGRPSLPSVSSLSAMSSHNTIPLPDEDELRRELALSQLLTLMEIPVLDGIINYSSSPPNLPVPQSGLAFSNMAFRRCESVMSLISDHGREDVWWESGLDVVECLPKGLDILDDSLSQHSGLTQKLRLYQCLVDHYTTLAQPLWSDTFTDLQVAQFNLLMQQKRDVALRAVQLALVLLPSELNEELHRLLIFLQHAADDEAVSLSTTEKNRQNVQNTFTQAIINNKVLAPHQAGQLVMFMIDHAHHLWDPIPDVEDMLRDHMNQLADGQRKPRSGKTFCTRVSLAEYQKQAEEATEQALVDMMNHILDHTKLSIKDKKLRLKQFKKHHPKFFWKHFSDIKW